MPAYEVLDDIWHCMKVSGTVPETPVSEFVLHVVGDAKCVLMRYDDGSDVLGFDGSSIEEIDFKLQVMGYSRRPEPCQSFKGWSTYFVDRTGSAPPPEP